jgi:hypothetical protein
MAYRIMTSCPVIRNTQFNVSGMHLVLVAWGYVVVMMAVVEATAPNGTVLGALFTLLLYGALPLWIVLYLLGTPARRAARKAQDGKSADPDGGGHAAGDAVPPEREEP